MGVCGRPGKAGSSRKKDIFRDCQTLRHFLRGPEKPSGTAVPYKPSFLDQNGYAQSTTVIRSIR